MRSCLKYVSVFVSVLALCAISFAADASSLKPPAGAKVAIVVFEDLQCPDCARAYPVVWETAKAYKIPVVLHDFPLPMHNWSFKAAVFARYFDTKSEKLGDDYRGYIYRNQPSITPANLQQYTQKFADDNKTPLPFMVDPSSELSTKVKADYSLGQRLGLEHTPTIFIIGNGGASTPFVEVTDRAKMGEIIEDMLKKAAPVAPAKPAAGAKKKAIIKAVKKG
jgi:protein-disulfide isomerase